jgi:hypothetical protein
VQESLLLYGNEAVGGSEGRSCVHHSYESPDGLGNGCILLAMVWNGSEQWREHWSRSEMVRNGESHSHVHHGDAMRVQTVWGMVVSCWWSHGTDPSSEERASLVRRQSEWWREC